MSSDTAGPTAPVIRLVGLGKRYEIYAKPHHRLLQTLLRGKRQYFREFWALRGVDLVVARGETVGVIGRNGSGKSTLLQLVAGTLFATEGSVSVTGRIAALLELGSGFNPEFTGRENVFLNGAILGISRSEMKSSFDAIAEFAGIGDFLDQPVKTYSSGMLVRLAFAVAVHVTPDILIVDEALAVGDTPFQSKCLERIRKMQEAGVAILLVSHSPNTIIEFCNRAVYLDRGRVVADGACREVLERYSNDTVTLEGGIAVRFPAPGIPPSSAPSGCRRGGARSPCRHGRRRGHRVRERRDRECSWRRQDVLLAWRDDTDRRGCGVQPRQRGALLRHRGEERRRHFVVGHHHRPHESAPAAGFCGNPPPVCLDAARKHGRRPLCDCARGRGQRLRRVPPAFAPRLCRAFRRAARIPRRHGMAGTLCHVHGWPRRRRGASRTARLSPCGSAPASRMPCAVRADCSGSDGGLRR